MQNFYSSSAESDKKRFKHLKKSLAKADFMKFYSKKQLEEISRRFSNELIELRKMHSELYVNYLQLRGMTYEEACFYDDYSYQLSETPRYNELEKSEWELEKILYPALYFMDDSDDAGSNV